MKAILVGLIVFAECSLAIAKQEEIHEDWIRSDASFIEALKNAYSENPANIINVLKPDRKDAIQLGFGYSMIEGNNGKGYVSTFYQLVYKDNVLVSFELEQQMPTDTRLTGSYKKMYSGLFEVDGDKVKPKYYNYQEMSKPLGGYKGVAHSYKDLDFYMTPYSGVIYGVRGGYANSLLKNREYYLALKSNLAPDSYEYLLYSKNPATRLMAIESFQSQKNMDKRIKDRIEVVLNELPYVVTMSGCIVHSDSARKLVVEYRGNNHQ
jgi:hypothetical protein